MKRFGKWIAGLFDADSSVSSKRFVLIVLSAWAVFSATFYVVKVQYGGVESSSTVTLLEFALGSIVSLGVGGTAAEALKRSKKNGGENEK